MPFIPKKLKSWIFVWKLLQTAIHGIYFQGQECAGSVTPRCFKMNRNRKMPSSGAGKLYYSEYIVPHGYNVTGNGERDMHSEKMPATA